MHRSGIARAYDHIFPYMNYPDWDGYLALPKDIFIWRVELGEWPYVRQWSINNGFQRIFVSLTLRSRRRFASMPLEPPYPTAPVMTEAEAKSYFPDVPGIEYYGCIGGDPAWYRKEWDVENPSGSLGPGDPPFTFASGGVFPDDAPVALHHWNKIQEYYNVLHGLCIDFEPHVIPRFNPGNEPFIDWNNHWFWRDDDTRWVGNPTDTYKRELRRRWARNSLVTYRNMRNAISKRSWLGPTPFIGVTSSPFALRSMDGDVISTAGVATEDIGPNIWLPNGSPNFYAEFCKVPDETVIMSYRSSAKEIAWLTRTVQSIQREVPDIAPITFGITTQAGTLNSPDPVLTAIRNGGFYMTGGGLPRYVFALREWLQSQPASLKWTGRTAMHQYLTSLQLGRPDYIPPPFTP